MEASIILPLGGGIARSPPMFAKKFMTIICDKKFRHTSAKVLLKSDKGFIYDDPNARICLSGSCRVPIKALGYFPIAFQLTNKIKTGIPKANDSDLTLKVVVAMNAEADPETEDEDGEIFYSWLNDIGEWDFCLIKMNFCDFQDQIVLTKFLHIDHDMEDCGCDPLYPNKACTLAEMDKLQHYGKISITYNLFCSLEQIRPLCRHYSWKCGFEIPVIIEFTLATDDTSTDILSNEVNLVHVRNNMGDPDITFKIVKTGEILKAHKSVLRGSELLNYMLNTESEEVKRAEILVVAEWVTKELFEDFLDGLYNHWTLDDMEQSQNDLSLLLRRLKLCHFYRCPYLFSHVLGTIVGRANHTFNLKQALHLFETGCHYGNSCLKYRALQWIESERKSSRGLLTLTPEQKNEILQLLKTVSEDVDRQQLIITAGLQGIK